MTDWLEFHDSTLTGFDARETHVELLLDAYIHRWERLDDPVPISDGWLQLHSTAPSHVVRLPLQVSGAIRIRLELTTADVVELTGSAVRIETMARDARYIEKLPAELRPLDPG